MWGNLEEFFGKQDALLLAVILLSLPEKHVIFHVEEKQLEQK